MEKNMKSQVGVWVLVLFLSLNFTWAEERVVEQFDSSNGTVGELFDLIDEMVE